MTFRHTRHGTTARFSQGESTLLAELLVQLIDLLEGDDDVVEPAADADPLVALTGISDEPAEKPTDPVVARLLPDAYRDDPERAAEFRRFTESDLVAGKQAHIRTLLASLDEVGLTHGGSRIRLDQAATQAWLYALNDLRLALGTRLDVTEDTYAELDYVRAAGGEDPRAVSLSIYIWLGYLQESLVDAIS